MNPNVTFQEYRKKALTINKINYWDLPINTRITLSQSIKEAKLNGKSITLKRLNNLVKKNSKINNKISSILFFRDSRELSLNLPLSLNNLNFVELYSLMVSEGSYKTEFRLHVPEPFFHDIFAKSLKNLFNKKIEKHIRVKENKGVLRSTAPTIIRHLIPIPKHIPKIILDNKKYCKRYLQIAFEAEGSPIFVGSKRYLSLKRNVDVTPILKNKINYPKEKRIYFGQLKKDYPKLAKKINNMAPKTLVGERLILKKYFNIESILKPEAIRINKTSYRVGEISARWALYIYADSVNRFINEIDFIGKRKKSITKKMSKIKGYKSQYSTLKMMKKMAKNGIFKVSDFVKEMKKEGYISPRTYLWRYEKKGRIKRINRGIYKIIS
ncbi:MAG: hypothetical protein KKH88_00390 [Nanoarchaeota archaeon]|nr:hypothetical protein [Nanoarchaeota archaeon]MBU1444713.1 hypothetical protein [Nanoarchaeota archaeon]MBU2406574.1 hypothetical protein [Nanoarchaeota archaeon]MBU2420565.1 hypothetical protein [Nanoarchaeota archaeon]MBU2475788.1 hypothetical protein [Nanoarchaeota archaeon]